MSSLIRVDVELADLEMHSSREPLASRRETSPEFTKMVCSNLLLERHGIRPMAVLLMIGGKLPAQREKPAHMVGLLPPGRQRAHLTSRLFSLLLCFGRLRVSALRLTWVDYSMFLNQLVLGL